MRCVIIFHRDDVMDELSCALQMPKLKPNEENELKNKIGTFILDRRKLKEQLAAEE